jgi:hypothetical protein
MARIRTLKPETWESEKLGRLTLLSRVNFIGLISLADDEGRGRGDSAFLLARLHPYAADVKLDAMRESLAELEKTGLVIFYQAVDCSYYAIPSWSENQKIDHPSPSKLPAPSTKRARRTLANVREDSPKAREDSGEDQGMDQGREGTKEADGFAVFWAAYPRKDKKKEALSAWGKLKPGAELQATILADVKKRALSNDWQKNAGQFVPLPASYLNAARWEDQGVILPKPAPVPDALTAAHLAARGIA